MKKKMPMIRTPIANVQALNKPWNQKKKDFPSIEIIEEDASLVATIHCRISGEYEIAIGDLSAAMKYVACQVENRDGLVGHIKAFIREEVRNAMLSLTDSENLQRKDGESRGIHVDCAYIVFGLQKAELDQLLHKAYKNWLDLSL